MKLRLEGTPAECEQAARLLGQVLTIVSISDPHPNRGRSRLVRVYVESHLDPARTPPTPAEPRRLRVTLFRACWELPAR